MPDKKIGLTLGGGDSKVLVVNLSSRQAKNGNDYSNAFLALSRGIDIMLDNAFKRSGQSSDELLAIEPSIKKGFANIWYIENLEDKYNAGVESFVREKKRILNWL